MAIKIPSNASAALAGVWSVLGAIPLSQWMRTHAPSDEHVLVQVAGLIFFLFLPVHYFVYGASRPDRSLTFFERIRRAGRDRPPGAFLRGVCWFAGAVGTMIALTAVHHALRVLR
jgi:hypothetical protein